MGEGTRDGMNEVRRGVKTRKSRARFYLAHRQRPLARRPWRGPQPPAAAPRVGRHSKARAGAGPGPRRAPPRAGEERRRLHVEPARGALSVDREAVHRRRCTVPPMATVRTRATAGTQVAAVEPLWVRVWGVRGVRRVLPPRPVVEPLRLQVRVVARDGLFGVQISHRRIGVLGDRRHGQGGGGRRVTGVPTPRAPGAAAPAAAAAAAAVTTTAAAVTATPGGQCLLPPGLHRREQGDPVREVVGSVWEGKGLG